SAGCKRKKGARATCLRPGWAHTSTALPSIRVDIRLSLLNVIILTHQEELNLPHALHSLKDLDCEIFVVDSGSTDRTVEIAEAFGARVVKHSFENQARQLNWALDTLPLAANWTLRLDADERLTNELAAEIRRVILSPPTEIAGYLIKRRVYFWGRW